MFCRDPKESGYVLKVGSESGCVLIMHVKTVEIMNNVKGDGMIQAEEE